MQFLLVDSLKQHRNSLCFAHADYCCDIHDLYNCPLEVIFDKSLFSVSVCIYGTQYTNFRMDNKVLAFSNCKEVGVQRVLLHVAIIYHGMWW